MGRNIGHHPVGRIRRQRPAWFRTNTTRRMGASAARRSSSPRRAGRTRCTAALSFRHGAQGLNAYQRYNGPGSLNPGTPASRGLLRDRQRFNQMGGSIGGPLWKDRLFAFFSYETERNNSSVTSTGWYETSAFDGLAPSGSIASQFLTFPGAGVNSSGHHRPDLRGCGPDRRSELHYGSGPGTEHRIAADESFGFTGSKLDKSRPLPAWEADWTVRADIAEYTTVDPTNVVNEQYNGRLDANVTAKDHAAFAIYWVPTRSDALQRARFANTICTIIRRSTMHSRGSGITPFPPVS